MKVYISILTSPFLESNTGFTSPLLHCLVQNCHHLSVGSYGEGTELTGELKVPRILLVSLVVNFGLH